MQKQPQIDEMIAFLEAKDPKAIQSIRKDNPSFEKILEKGAICGPSEDINELRVRAEVCFKATKVTMEKCDVEITALRAKLKIYNKINLCGQIITTISGASVITTLLTEHHNLTYLAGVFSLAGALIPLIIDFKRKGLGHGTQMDEIYFDLIKLRREAEENYRELTFFVENKFNIPGIIDVIKRCNQLCLDIKEKQLIA